MSERARVAAALELWLEEHGFASTDPYDALTSPLLRPALRLPWVGRVCMQVVKRSPIDLRPLLGIRPAVYTKSLSDLTAVYALRARRDSTAADKARYFLSRLRDRRLPDVTGSAWGMDLPYVSRFATATPKTPNLYQTVNAASACLDVHALGSAAGEQAEMALEMALGVVTFLEEGLGRLEETTDRIAWRYYPGQDACVYNVNALAGAFLIRLGRTTDRPELVELGRRTLRFVVAAQNEDGSWWYARGPAGRWIDGFHSGFVLDALGYAVQTAGETEFAASHSRGASFYLEKMFTKEDVPRYDARSTYPIEVQNCAQAIQTLALLARHDRELLARAVRTADAVIASLFRWTRRSETSAGYFTLARHRHSVRELASVRWGQAPMLLALEHLTAAELAGP